VAGARLHYLSNLKQGTDTKPLTTEEKSFNTALKDNMSGFIASADEKLIDMEARFQPHLVCVVDTTIYRDICSSNKSDA
jgi:hypothetical protein